MDFLTIEELLSDGAEGGQGGFWVGGVGLRVGGVGSFVSDCGFYCCTGP